MHGVWEVRIDLATTLENPRFVDGILVRGYNVGTLRKERMK